jgi:2-methylcitrate dehydratase PrpD
LSAASQSPPGRFARQLADDLLATQPTQDGLAKVKLCLLDFLSCAFEARTLPWSVQAATIARRSPGTATIIGTRHSAAIQEAAFANGVAGHGLVREDIHAGAVSHLGVVVLPSLFALAQRDLVSGETFAAAAIAGYQVGAWIGRALVTPRFSRQWRPTGFTGPLAAAAAGSRILQLSAAQTVSALALAANTASGLNEWPGVGGEDMFFHPGTAARNGLMAVELAELGATGTDTALDGAAGLFAAVGASPPAQRLFAGGLEILAVFHKPLPLCNFAQTPAQAALQLARAHLLPAQAIASIQVDVSEAARSYPGCDGIFPFDRVLQAKMSIPFCVAAALADGVVAETSFAILDRPDLLRLAAATRLTADPAFTAAFPGRQGATVSVTLRNGEIHRTTMPDLEPASPEAVRARFTTAAREALGADRAAALLERIDTLEHQPDMGALIGLCAPGQGP